MLIIILKAETIGHFSILIVNARTHLVFFVLNLTLIFSTVILDFLYHSLQIFCMFRVLSLAKCRLLMFLSIILNSYSTPLPHNIYSDIGWINNEHIQHCLPSLLTWSQSVLSCSISTMTYWPIHRFHIRIIKCFQIIIFLSTFHSLIWLK